MKHRNNLKGRLNTTLPAAALFAALLLVAPATALSSVDAEINGTTTTYDSLTEAIVDIGSTSQNVILTIKDNQTAGTFTTTSAWDLRGIIGNITINGGDKTLTLGTPPGALMTIEGSPNVTINKLTFKNGLVPTTSSRNVAGGLAVNLPNGGKLALSELTFADNKITKDSTALSNGAAMGAGLAVTGDLAGDSLVTLDKATFTGNTARNDGSTKDDNTWNAMGGGARIVGIAGDDSDNHGVYISNGTFENNKAEGVKISHAHGGALALENNEAVYIVNTTFEGNIASIDDIAPNVGNPQSFARGGAIFTANYSDDIADGGAVFVTGSTFKNNQAQAKGTSTMAFGGAIATWHDTVNAAPAALNINESLFTGNKAVGTDDAIAKGGALYLHGDTTTAVVHTINNTSLTGNSAESNVADSSWGGAIYAEGGTDITISATNTYDSSDNLTKTGKTEISDNIVNGIASGIQFGDGSGAKSNLTISGDGTILLLDPVLVNLDNDFTMTVDNYNATQDVTGDFTWGGVNRFNVGANTATIDFVNSSVTNLAKDYTAIAESGSTLAVVFGDSDDPGTFADLNISLDRDPDLAILDASAPGSTLTITQNCETINLGVANKDRQLIDISGKYLIAATENNTAATTLADSLGSANIVVDENIEWNNGTTGLTLEGSNIYADITFASQMNAIVAASNRNTAGAINDLHEVLQNISTIDDATYEGIKRNWNAATSEYGMTQGQVALQVTRAVANAARGIALGKNSFAVNPLLAAQPASFNTNSAADGYGFRAWAGYVGNFINMDSHDNLLGYNATTHGIAFGLNYDFSSDWTVGVFGAYTNTNTDMKNAKSEVDGDGLHAGIVLGWTPQQLAGLAASLDATYSNYNNDGWRKADGVTKTKASFDQNVISVGLGVEYAVPLTTNYAVTPFIDMRYSYLDQDGYTEKGILANKVKAMDATSFTTSLGARLDANYAFENAVLKPYVSAAWRHEFGDRQFDSRAAYVGGTGNGFKLSSVEADRDSVDLGLGASLMDKNNQYGINMAYDFNLGSNSNSHNVYVGFKLNF